MKILIVEDEYHAAQRLQKLIHQFIDQAQILNVIDSVEDTVDWLKKNEAPDLIFLDIQLADDLSFSIFNKVDVASPIIFTTAFDQYAMRAFKLNSIDYLLKPIDEEELKHALAKYHELNKDELQPAMQSLQQLIQKLQLEKSYKDRFLLKSRDKYDFLLSDDIAYFYSEDSLTFIITLSGKKHIYDETLSSLHEQLDPKKFFRINRKQIIHVQAISKIHNYFNSRLKVDLKPKGDDIEALVSREKVKDFKVWLGA